MSKYDDIINLNRPISKHKHQSIDSRAAQFAPFAALTGYESAIKETARLTDEKIEVNDELREILNNKLNFLNNHIKEKNEVTIFHFIKDDKKNGGKYVSKKGIIKRIDPVNETIKFEDNTIITMNDIIDIKGDLFED
ncbi:MAG: hypothetical protein IJA94_06435 [Bacilli bacterium]|nr:hypothetical protein [Bacilli bacterium]